MEFLRRSDFVKRKEHNSNDKITYLVLCMVCTRIAPKYQAELEEIKNNLLVDREEWEPEPQTDNIDNYDVIEKVFMKFVPEIDMYRCFKCKNEVSYEEIKKRAYYNEGKYILNDHTLVSSRKIRSIAEYTGVEKQGLSNIGDPNFDIKRQKSDLFYDNEDQDSSIMS